MLGKFAVIWMILAWLGCKPPSPESQLAISNGKDAAKLFPAVARLKIFDTSVQKLKTCTGTFVSSQTLITAAHCVRSIKRPERDLNNVEIFIGNNQAIKPRRIFRHPKYSRFAAANKSDEFDVAVITINQNVQDTVPVSLIIPPVRSEITLVGFGLESAQAPQSGRVKRWGKNIVDATDEGQQARGNIGSYIRFSGVSSRREAASKGVAVGEDVINLVGDSGGPMFYRNTLVAVSSAGATNTALYANLNHPEIQDWFTTLRRQERVVIPAITDFSQAPKDIMGKVSDPSVTPDKIRDKNIYFGLLKDGNDMAYYVTVAKEVDVLEYCVFTEKASECKTGEGVVSSGLPVDQSKNPNRKFFLIRPQAPGGFDTSKHKIFLRSKAPSGGVVKERSIRIRK